MKLLKHHEFWPGRWYEAPAYAWLAFECWRRGISVKSMMKANYGMEHGGAGFVSKYGIQEYIGQDKFPKTILLKGDQSAEEKAAALTAFTTEVGYPVVMKPDKGFTGRGIFKLDENTDLKSLLPLMKIDYLAQAFAPSNVEFGVFYVRLNGEPKIIGINRKHFPTIVGDGQHTIKELVESHPRYNHFWHSYLPYHDLEKILDNGVVKRLSFIGSHTMGCKFTNDTYLVTRELEQAVFALFEDTPGFNFGRLDLLSDSVEAFQAGEFAMIEVNAVNALPTNVFDPELNVWESYRIFFDHFTYLAKIGYEHRKRPMPMLSWPELARLGTAAQDEVMDQQDLLEQELPKTAFV